MHTGAYITWGHTQGCLFPSYWFLLPILHKVLQIYLTFTLNENDKMNAFVAENGDETEATKKLESTYKLDLKRQSLISVWAFQALLHIWIYLHLLIFDSFLVGSLYPWVTLPGMLPLSCPTLPPGFPVSLCHPTASWLLEGRPWWGLPAQPPSLQKSLTLGWPLSFIHKHFALEFPCWKLSLGSP